jgi:hypothetical protein
MYLLLYMVPTAPKRQNDTRSYMNLSYVQDKNLSLSSKLKIIIMSLSREIDVRKSCNKYMI